MGSTASNDIKPANCYSAANVQKETTFKIKNIIKEFINMDLPGHIESRTNQYKKNLIISEHRNSNKKLDSAMAGLSFDEFYKLFGEVFFKTHTEYKVYKRPGVCVSFDKFSKSYQVMYFDKYKKLHNEGIVKKCKKSTEYTAQNSKSNIYCSKNKIEINWEKNNKPIEITLDYVEKTE